MYNTFESFELDLYRSKYKAIAWWWRKQVSYCKCENVHSQRTYIAKIRHKLHKFTVYMWVSARCCLLATKTISFRVDVQYAGCARCQLIFAQKQIFMLSGYTHRIPIPHKHNQCMPIRLPNISLCERRSIWQLGFRQLFFSHSVLSCSLCLDMHPIRVSIDALASSHLSSI